MIGKSDKKIFYGFLGICIVGYLYVNNFGVEPEADKVSAYDQCIADNNLTTDLSVIESHLANIPEPTEEMANEYIKEYLEKGEATFGGKEAEENDKKLSDEIERYTKLALELCGDKIGSSS